MAALPPASDFTDAARTEGQAKTFISTLRDFLSGLLGTDGTAATARTALGVLALAGGTLTGLLTVNGQIKFPAVQNASADANTLDDYEEGTWTPDPEGSVTPGAPTGTFAGHYVKIGQLVWVSAQLVFTGLDTMAGNFIIKALPFAAINSISARSGLTVAFRNNFTNDFTMLVRTVENATELRVHRANADNTDIGIADLSATTNLYFSGSYRAAA